MYVTSSLSTRKVSVKMCANVKLKCVKYFGIFKKKWSPLVRSTKFNKKNLKIQVAAFVCQICLSHYVSVFLLPHVTFCKPFHSLTCL